MAEEKKLTCYDCKLAVTTTEQYPVCKGCGSAMFKKAGSNTPINYVRLDGPIEERDVPGYAYQICRTAHDSTEIIMALAKHFPKDYPDKALKKICKAERLLLSACIAFEKNGEQ